MTEILKQWFKKQKRSEVKLRDTKIFKDVQKLTKKKVETLHGDVGNCLLNTGNRKKRKTEEE